MAGMLNLRNILQLVNDGFDDGTLADQQAITQRHETIIHVALELGNQLHPHAFKQLLSQLLRDIALVSKHLTKLVVAGVWARECDHRCYQVSAQS